MRRGSPSIPVFPFSCRPSFASVTWDHATFDDNPVFDSISFWFIVASVRFHESRFDEHSIIFLFFYFHINFSSSLHSVHFDFDCAKLRYSWIAHRCTVQYFIRYYVYQQRRVVLHARVGCANDSAYAAYLFAQVAVNVVSERVLCVCRPKFISSPNTNVDTAKTLILILSHDNSCAHCVRCAPLMCECVWLYT